MDSLREKYNPDGSLLRTAQKELLNMLLYIDKICKDNNISWWLSSGTLLGAARHKGFIPWDDDMDIVMLKKDLKRLERILIKQEHEEFVYHCRQTDCFYVNIFGKFRKKKGCINVSNPRYKYYKWKGIGLDIFAIEKISLKAVMIGNRFYTRLMSISDYISAPVVKSIYIRLVQFFNFNLVFPVCRLLGKYNPNQEYHYILGTGWSKHTFYMKDVYPLGTTDFEGFQMPVPHDMDSYLKNVYGDWRKLPSEEEIKNSIHCQEYRTQIYGNDN